MPSRPYFHGDEEFYELGGVLVAHSPSHPIPSGMSIETANVLTLDRRYCLGLWMAGRIYGPSAILWRTGRGDHIKPPTLAALIEAAHRVFGPNPRYRMGDPCAGPASPSTASRSVTRSTLAGGPRSVSRSAHSARRTS